MLSWIEHEMFFKILQPRGQIAPQSDQGLHCLQFLWFQENTVNSRYLDFGYLE